MTGAAATRAAATGATPAGTARVRRSSAQVLVPAVAACALSLGVLVPWVYLRAALVFPVALLLPGYAILLLAFGPGRRFDWVPALALAALLSMAFYPLAALLLAAVSVAPSTRSVIGAVDVLVAASLLACVPRGRRRRAPGADASWLPTEPARDEPEPGMSGRRVLVLVTVALAVGGLGLGVARHVEPKPVAQPYTAFYLTGARSHLSTPVRARAGKPLSVVVGVKNRTHRRQTYRLTPTIDGRAAWPARVVTLAPGAAWTGSVRGPAPGTRGLHELVVALSAKPQGARIGTLTLWLKTTLPR